jgi:dipeptidyl aminopeptidase/acylaminoacyl peptidase
MEHDGYESDKNRIFVYDLLKKERFDLTKTFDNNADHPTWSGDSQTIFALSGSNATEQIFAFDVVSKKSKQVTTGVWDFQSMKVLNKNTLVGGRVSMSNPAELYSVNVQNGACTALTNTNDELWGTVKKGEVRKRMVKTTDGKEMQVWVIYPPDFDPKKKYPALLYCQGGPQSMVSQFFSYRWNFQLMANNGYIVVAPCRRGMPGFGTAWNEAISGDWGGQAQTDLLSAIDDVRKESYIDNKKIGCVGASYGGYSAYWLAGNHNKRFSCFISHCGLFNLESWYGTTEELWFANKDIGGAYWQSPQPKNYVSYNPQKFVGNWDSPMLVIHSEKDFRVPIGEGIQAFQAAQLRNIPSRFLYLPEEGHWVGAPQTSVLWQRVFYDWLGRYLK